MTNQTAPKTQTPAKLTVYRGDKTKQFFKDFTSFVHEAFDQRGLEVNERFAWVKGEALVIDRAYLSLWTRFEENGYQAAGRP